MSEKDHSVKEFVKKIAARIRKDLFQYRTALFAVAGYFLFMHVGCNAGCPSVCLTGFPCPACGLTRAARLLFCAKFAEAYRMNPMIYPMILFLCAFFFYRYILGRKLPHVAAWGAVLLIACIVIYIYRMLTQFPGEAPMGYYRENLLYKILDRIYRKMQKNNCAKHKNMLESKNRNVLEFQIRRI